ncbi:DUF6798 domain-containing protein [Occallatibacter riparius]|uniref:Uncharacterized protein n=1 Tax=Occallatibacter riparius TaxID=1002689 RepID=A0A9J7BQ23_9BACT|nr:DUF6798 domain-containing protein [Occallatibacter riparius]UWZ83038.1 hypothetical protein MOP44_21005 [Occallatibacter riparius]
MPFSERKPFPILRLAGLTLAALAIHGYYFGVEDAEIYVPAAKKLANPALYPFSPEFFLDHEHLSIFGSVVAATSHFTHLPIDWSIFLWYVVCLFGMIASCWLIASGCFTSSRARWSAVGIVTAVLAMPAANTALLLNDPYLTARSFSTPLTLIALGGLLQRRYALAGVTALITGLFHPQMVAYLMVLAVVILVTEQSKARAKHPVPALASAIAVLPTGFDFKPATGAYREVLYSRDYYFLYNWQWYHWLGMLAPLAILAWFWRGRLRGTTDSFSLLSFVMIPFGILSIVAAIVISSSPIFDNFIRLQPLRTFHLITIVFVILLAGVFGEFAGIRRDGRSRTWAIPALAGSLAIGMFFVGRATYPHSQQIELPAATSPNAWVNTLLWIRQNTPEDAVFAVDSHYLRDDLTDSHGFRAVSERSALADYYKDSGAASLFPTLADEWKQMSTATTGLNHFTQADFQRLNTEYPAVTWTVVHGPALTGLNCPYQQQGYAVCRIPSATSPSTTLSATTLSF